MKVNLALSKSLNEKLYYLVLNGNYYISINRITFDKIKRFMQLEKLPRDSKGRFIKRKTS